MSKTKYQPIPESPPLCCSRVRLRTGRYQIRFGQQPGWDPRAREGSCEVHIWVDHHAEMRLRGDRIFVRTLEGAKSYDEGSKCSQPLPYNSIGDLQIRQIAGRNRVD